MTEGSHILHLDLDDQRPLRRVWEFGFNTCHAPLVMRSDLQEQMCRAHSELGMRYWRCHGTLSDDVGLIFVDGGGRPHYCFSGLKRILDAGLRTGVVPFLELSFMPAALAQDPSITLNHYRSLTSPPRDFRKWRELIFRTGCFLAETYGLTALRRWFYEIWNEPNIPFWAGDQAGYFRLYREAALAIKAVDDRLRVGGPATARGAWVADLLAYCQETRTPIDFLSTHIYPSDVPFMEAAHGAVNLLGIDFVHGHFQRVRAEANAATFRGPIIWGEWNSSAGPLAANHDECNNGALIAGMLAGIEENADGSLFWNLSDIYEECGFHFAPFHGGYGLYTVDGLAKSGARAFELFHQLLAKRIGVQGAPASRARGILVSGDEKRREIALVLWNHLEPGTRPSPWKVRLKLGDFSASRLERRQILPGRGSAYEAWLTEKKPMNLSPSVLRRLTRASVPLCRRQSWAVARTSVELTIRPGTFEFLRLS